MPANSGDEANNNRPRFDFRRRRRRLLEASPDTPITYLDDESDAERDGLVLVSDEERKLIAWRVSQDREIRMMLRRRAKNRGVWDHRWVRLSAYGAAAGLLVTFGYVVISLLSALSSFHAAGH